MDVTYQEEGVRHECVPEHGPANPTSTSFATAHDAADCDSDYNADELVARVGDEIEPLRFVRDAEQICTELEQDQLNQDHCKCIGGCQAEKLRSESAPETG